jgi:phosphoenolpyruvate carboxykinase (GTP)
LGAVGKRSSNPMANMDFVIVPLALYIKNHINFGRKLKKCPRIYATNYFLKGEDGRYLNGKLDKRVWVLWAEGRVHGEYEAIRTPIGYIPKYEDLAILFKDVFSGREYTQREYVAQFSIRIEKYLEKYARMEAQYQVENGMPEEFMICLQERREELLTLQMQHQKHTVSPFDL